jgi:hypothetical protein
VLGHLPIETLWVDVMDELVTKFQKHEEWHSHLEKSGARVCDLFLEPPFGQV